jgi:hypothetical protein
VSKLTIIEGYFFYGRASGNGRNILLCNDRIGNSGELNVCQRGKAECVSYKKSGFIFVACKLQYRDSRRIFKRFMNTRSCNYFACEKDKKEKKNVFHNVGFSCLYNTQTEKRYNGCLSAVCSNFIGVLAVLHV